MIIWFNYCDEPIPRHDRLCARPSRSPYKKRRRPSSQPHPATAQIAEAVIRASNSSESDSLSGWWSAMVLCSIMCSTKNPALLTPTAQVTLFAQKPNPTGSLSTQRARRPRSQGTEHSYRTFMSTASAPTATASIVPTRIVKRYSNSRRSALVAISAALCAFLMVLTTASACLS